MSDIQKFSAVKDSGARQNFTTGSVRDTNDGKPRFDLISLLASHRLAMHYSNGAKKYGDRNWEKGQPLSRYIESTERHLFKLKMGFTDEDHEAAAIWNLMAFVHTRMMIEAGALPKELDNMPKYSEEVKSLVE